MEMAPSLVGILGFVVLFVLVLLNVPIAFAFALIGMAGVFYFAGLSGALGVATSTIWSYGTNYMLMAVPLFILMGQFASASGIGDELYDTASKWLGRLPGGLAIATIWGCA